MASELESCTPTRAERRTGRILLVSTGAVLALTVLVVLLRPQDANVDYEQWWVLAGLVAGLLAALALTAWAGRRDRRVGDGRRVGPRPWASWVVAGALSVAGGVAGVLLALPLRYAYGWDAAVVTGFSRELWSRGTLSPYAQDYLSRYPNNVPLVALMNAARAVGGSTNAQMYDAFIVANGVCLAVVLVLTYALVRRLRGSGPAFVAQGVVFVLVGCSPWMAVPYTDLPAMPFVTAAAVLAVAATRCARASLRRWCLVALAFAAVAVAFVVKTTPATTAVALALAVLVIALGRPWRDVRQLALLAVTGLAVFAVTVLGAQSVAAATAKVPRERLDSSKTLPVTAWLANGLSTTSSLSGRPYFGGYNPQLVKESQHLSGQALQTWSDARLSRQVTSMGVGGIASFEVHKQAFNWGDGMFFAWGEGYDAQPSRLQVHGSWASWLQSLQHPSGAHYLLRASLTNGLWLALLLWAGLGLLRAPYRRDLLVMVLTTLGIAVFTLVFQGRSRYLFAYVPVVVALAAAVNPLRGGPPAWKPARQPARQPDRQPSEPETECRVPTP